VKTKLSATLILAFFLASCGGGGGEGGSQNQPLPQTQRSATTSVAGKVNGETATRAPSQTFSPTVKLIVDSNGDGTFDEKTDKVYETVATNGKFQLLNVEVPEKGAKANLIISLDGYAPYSKVLDLSPNNPVTLDVQLVPASTKVVPITRERRAGGKLFLTLTKSGEIKVSSGVRAVSIEDSQLTVEVDTKDLPESVTAIKATMKTFNSAKREDIKYFPGEFKGEDPKGNGEVGLESLTFALIDLKDQDGNPLKVSSGRAGECLYEVTQTLPAEAIAKIKEKGDFDESTPGCQVPIYSYSYNSQSWDFLGTGEVKDSSGNPVNCDELDETKTYTVDICITEPNWGDYVNLDYPVYFSQVKTGKLCFFLKDAQNEPVAGTWFELYSQGIYLDVLTDESGKAEIEIPVTANTSSLSCSDLKQYLSEKGATISYYGSDYRPIPLDLGKLEETEAEGCTCAFNVKMDVSYVNAVVKAVSESGEPLVGKEVCLRDEGYYYYDCKVTDESGSATFKVVAGRTYVAFGSGLSEDKEEVSQDTTFTLKESNNPPVVSLYVYPSPVKKGKDVTVEVYAYDVDGDDLKLEGVNCGDFKGELLYEDSFFGYLTAVVKCKFDSEGSYSVTGRVTDGKVSSEGATTVSVISENAPPVVYGYIFRDENGNYVSPYTLKPNTTYSLILYAYDPDGDDLTFSVDSQECSVEGSIISCTFSQAGSKTFNVTVSDGTSSVTETIEVEVGQGIAPEIVYVDFDRPQVLPGEEVELLAYVYDPDSESIQPSLSVNGEAIEFSGSCSPLEDYLGYFECELKVSVPEDVQPGEYQVELSVKDESSQFSNQTIPVVVGTPDRPPTFTKPLPTSLRLNVGDSYTFEVEAVDPEGENLSYVWYVNGEKVAEGSNTFTYAFTEAGIYKVKVEVNDGNSSVSSETTVTVVNPAETNRLVLHLGVEGVYVSLLDDNLKVVRTLVTDESGTVDFGEVDKDTVNLAVTISPDVVLDEETLFNRFINRVYYSCYSNDPSCSLSYSQVQTWNYFGKIPLNPVVSYISSEAESYDKDGDGFLSADEVYNFVVAHRDANGDGKIQLKEILQGNPSVSTTVIKDVKVKEYVIDDVAEAVGYEFGYDFGYDFGYGRKLVNVKVTNVPEEVMFLDVSYDGCEVKDGVADCQVSVPLLEDGTYVLILRDYENNKAYVVKDGTSDTVTVDYSKFVPEKEVSAVNFDENADYEGLSLSAHYKGGTFFAGWFSSGNESNYVVDMGEGMNYFLHYDREKGGVEWYIDNFKLGSTLPSTLDVSQLRSNILNVNLDVDLEGRKVTLSGEDLSSVDEVDIEENYEGDNGEFRLELDMPYSGESSVSLPEVESVVPESVYNSYVKDILTTAERSVRVEAWDIENFNWGNDDESNEGLERGVNVTVYSGEEKRSEKRRRKAYKLWH